ncbi:MAG TPA: hypothetical protein VHR45_19235 [Thermoanaerobaculia bacterium]|nr:hypothetical protein [Thermoanaerobaculia bacterium]
MLDDESDRSARKTGSGHSRAALGLRAHSGWATLVAVAAETRSRTAWLRSPRSPRSVPSPPSPIVVVERRRIGLADPAIAGSSQPYHLAAAAATAAGAQGSARSGVLLAGTAARAVLAMLKDAERVVRRCTEISQRMAGQALDEVVEELRRRGHEVVGCGIVLGSGRPAATLAATLASHARIHGAEGELFRRVLVEASGSRGLAVTGVGERDLMRRGAADLHLPAAELEQQILALGRPLGPPWRQDEKLAALVAWLALAAATI